MVVRRRRRRKGARRILAARGRILSITSCRISTFPLQESC